MIINLRARVAHDKAVIKGRTSWQPIGNGYFLLVQQAVNVTELQSHKNDLLIALKGLKHYESLLGNERAWNCIHRYEASWDSTKNPVYDGGLQMDSGFQHTYGQDMLTRYGKPAWAWHPLDQMIVAERARRSGRGYYPWPNTARYCHLI